MKAVRKIGLLGAAGLGIATVAAVLPGTASAGNPNPFTGGDRPAANPRWGVQDNALVSGLDETSVAEGQLPLVRADTANGITHYGYNTSNGGPLTQNPREAFKTEPDKNVYLVFGHGAGAPLPLPGARGRPPRLRHPCRPRPDRPGEAGGADR